MKYRIPEPGTTISGFVDNKKNPDRPTLDFFDMCQKTHIFFLGIWCMFALFDACCNKTGIILLFIPGQTTQQLCYNSAHII